jgi:stage II sporulation protein D
VPDGAFVASLTSGDPVASLPPHSQWAVNASASKISFTGRSGRDAARLADTTHNHIQNVAFLGGRSVPTYNSFYVPPPQVSAGSASSGGYLIFAPSTSDSDQHLIGVNGKLYRGAVWLRPEHWDNGTPALTAINILDVEDYLLSVLPSEMPSTWPSAALQAQAIAARSYAIANLGKHAKDGYDLRATTDDQVYVGVQAERQASHDAVAATDGIVLKYAGKPITAFFHSTSGGSTEGADQVWGRQVPYLKSVVDYDDNSPHFTWTRKVAANDVEKAFGSDVGKVLAVLVVARTPTQRVRQAMVVGTQGVRLVSGDALRLALKLPSANFNIGYEDNLYSIAGRGFGHGLGMSQYGARALAEQGYNAAQILSYYYRDVSIEYVAGTPGI